MRPLRKATIMPIVFIAIVLIVSAILITRHIYLGKIEQLEVDHQNNYNRDFRMGHEAGWDGAMRYRDQKAEYDAIVIVK